MCGITFLFNPQLSSKTLSKKAEAASRLMHHRGPDEHGEICGRNWAAAHTRLSIIDIQASQQPMQDESGRYTLTYNGEIYNFLELRSILKGKWDFKTKGDTETLLAGLCVYGESFIENLQGMWAFAFWDKQSETLLLSRDRLGKKPLFYSVDKDFFACASELPALAQVSQSKWEEDYTSTADFLRYGFYLPGSTAYKNIKELLPGHNLIWKPNSSVSVSAYWKLSNNIFQGSKTDAAHLLNSILIDSIRKRMISDVEVGAFLSGGIDSSLVVALMRNELGITPKTFTIGFNEASYDERNYAKHIAKLYSSDHHEEILEEFSSDDLLTLIFDHCGQPFGDVSILPTSLLSKLASRHVKVVLSGDGADELFSGYQRYFARMLFRLYSQIPTSLTHLFEKVLQQFDEPGKHHSHSTLKKAKLFIKAYERHLENPKYLAPEFVTCSTLHDLTPGLPLIGHQYQDSWNIHNQDDIMEMMIKDATIYLPQDILTKVDRATMAFSLEARAPFLDTKLIEAAFSLPRHWHRNHTSGKCMLKKAFTRHLPARIWKRRKQGFSVPVSNWFRTFLGDQLEDLLSENKDPIFNENKVQQLISSHRNQEEDYSFTLWNIFIYLSWKTHNFNQKK